MARSKPPSALPAVRPALARSRATFEPENPLARALNRIKGDGRRRIVAGLAAINVPLARIPRVLLRENLTAFEHVTLWSSYGWPLGGEWLPDLLAGEVEEARVLWALPKDDRVLSLRARPQLGGAAWRLVDDLRSSYELARTWSPLPVTDRDVVGLLDAARGSSFPHGLGAFRSCWEEARQLGFERQRVREFLVVRSVVPGRRLAAAVDDLFEGFWNGEPGDGAGEAATAEVVQ